MPRFAANVSFLFTELPFLERIGAAAAAGFGAVECHYPYDTPAGELRAALTASGLPMLGINTRNGTGAERDAGVAAVPGRAAESDARLAQAIGYARAVGARAIHVTAGNAATGNADATAAFVRSLQAAADLAPELTILIEPLNRRQNPSYFLGGTTQALAVLDRVERPNAKLMFDIYHAQINEGDILARLGGLLPRIGHVQVAAVPSRAEPDEGELAYGAIFAALDAAGYDGWVGAEYRPRAATAAGLKWLRSAAASPVQPLAGPGVEQVQHPGLDDDRGRVAR